MTILGAEPWQWLLLSSLAVGVFNLRMSAVMVMHLLAFQYFKTLGVQEPQILVAFTIIYLLSSLIACILDEFITTFFMSCCCLLYVYSIYVGLDLPIRGKYADILMGMAIGFGAIDGLSKQFIGRAPFDTLFGWVLRPLVNPLKRAAYGETYPPNSQ